MPKKIRTTLQEAVIDDIRNHFRPGERYRSVRQVAEAFGVSVQTAQKVLSDLNGEGLLESHDRSGTFIREKTSPAGTAALKGTTILAVSNNGDPRFNEAFLTGIRQVIEPLGMNVNIWVPQTRNHSSLSFGEELVGQCRLCNASAAITLAFRNAELAFYHVIQNGITLISDVATKNLPILPSVQSDNHRHCAEAARQFAERGKKSILIAGYWSEGNVRQQSFQSEFILRVPDAKIKYVHLAMEISPADLYLYFRRFTAECAVFTTDYAANHTVAPYFLTYGISPKHCFMVYDSEFGEFKFPGLEPVPSAAPSLQSLGYRLAEKLLARMVTGEWTLPMDELL
jgi:DNA-binding LacI/PurR family transcriptional regulator